MDAMALAERIEVVGELTLTDELVRLIVDLLFESVERETTAA